MSGSDPVGPAPKQQPAHGERICGRFIILEPAGHSGLAMWQGGSSIRIKNFQVDSWGFTAGCTVVSNLWCWACVCACVCACLAPPCCLTLERTECTGMVIVSCSRGLSREWEGDREPVFVMGTCNLPYLWRGVLSVGVRELVRLHP